MLRKLSYKNFSFAYTFEENKEVISLIFINYFLGLLFTGIVIMLHLSDEELIPVTYRYHGIVLMALLNLVLIRYKQPRIARINVLILLPFLVLLLPHLAGLRDNEFYFWMPYIPVGLSLIVHFTFKPRKDRILIILFLSLYFLLGLGVENIMIFLSDMQEDIIPLVIENRFYYNLIPCFIYFFVNVGIGLVLLQNDSYEQRLHLDSQILEDANKNLSVQKQKLLEKNRDLDTTLQQLYETRDKLVQNEKLAALGTLTSGIAHEINNPLNFISASLEEMSAILKKHPDIFENDSSKGQQEHFLELMQYAEEGVIRVANIVTKLGTLKTRKSQVTQTVEISSLVHAAMTELQDSISPSVEVISEIPEKISITCNAIEIQQVLQSVLLNAIDAISEKEKQLKEQIVISVREEIIEKLNYVSISISNTGPLIPENELHKLFDPFYTTKSLSSGLGLSVSFSIVQQHKGILTVQNSGNVVVFKISLPHN